MTTERKQRFDPVSASPRPPYWRIHVVSAAALLALTAGVYVVGFAPLAGERLKIHAERTLLQERSTRLRTLDRDVRGSYEDLTKLEEQLRSAVKLRPAGYVNRRVNDVIGLVESSGLTLLEHTPEKPVFGKQFGTVSIRVQCEGTFPAAVAFLRSLHGQFPDIEVRNFSLRSNIQARADTPQFEMALVWYTLPEGGAIMAGEPDASGRGGQKGRAGGGGRAGATREATADSR